MRDVVEVDEGPVRGWECVVGVGEGASAVGNAESHRLGVTSQKIEGKL